MIRIEKIGLDQLELGFIRIESDNVSHLETWVLCIYYHLFYAINMKMYWPLILQAAVYRNNMLHIVLLLYFEHEHLFQNDTSSFLLHLH